MGTEDQQHRQRFDEIVGNLTTGDPEFRRVVEAAPRPLAVGVKVALLVVGALVWGLLSVAMVAWGWVGVLLTAVVVAAVAGVAFVKRRGGRR